MDPATAHKKNGRKATTIAARKGMAIVRKGVTITRAGAQPLLEHLRTIRTVYWAAQVVGNDDAANPVVTVLTAIVRYSGEILACLIN
ncbi:hypothetical protein [Nocardia sp. NPDC050717]|uniref:hypothetical protein n=1 Tax=Nocardia sp. NPDC050717 TaxID=3157221 RepID=UPI0033EE1F6D